MLKRPAKANIVRAFFVAGETIQNLPASLRTRAFRVPAIQNLPASLRTHAFRVRNDVGEFWIASYPLNPETTG